MRLPFSYCLPPACACTTGCCFAVFCCRSPHLTAAARVRAAVTFVTVLPRLTTCTWFVLPFWFTVGSGFCAACRSTCRGCDLPALFRWFSSTACLRSFAFYLPAVLLPPATHCRFCLPACRCQLVNGSPGFLRFVLPFRFYLQNHTYRTTIYLPFRSPAVLYLRSAAPFCCRCWLPAVLLPAPGPPRFNGLPCRVCPFWIPTRSSAACQTTVSPAYHRLPACNAPAAVLPHRVRHTCLPFIPGFLG